MVKTKNVAKLSVEARFLYWIKERHQIYLRRKAGKPKPWTDDEVLQSYFFTNPYRENDKTTVWFRENVREPLRNDPRVLMATIIFRWFNRIDTGQMLLEKGLLTAWQSKRAVKWLQLLHECGPVFTGAYMIKAGNGPSGCKIPNVCSAVSAVWKERKRLRGVCERDCRLQALWKELREFPHLGGFMSYEIVCDLRHTYLLGGASDVNAWTNLGPGAARGLQRIIGLPVESKVRPPADWPSRVQGLLLVARNKLPKMPRFELREIEHSLCEFDKYERMRLGQGKSKRKYDGGS